MALKAVSTSVGGGGGTIDLAANSVAANPTAGTAAAQSVTIGGPLSDRVFIGAGGNLVAQAGADYYLVGVADNSGFVGSTIVGAGTQYYSALRSPTSSAAFSITGAATGTANTTWASFITLLGDPGAGAFAAGDAKSVIYASVSDPTAVASCRVIIARRGPDGTETNVLTSASTSFSNTAVAGLSVLADKLAATALTFGPYERLIMRVQFARVSGPASFNITLTSDGIGNRSTVGDTVTGAGVVSPQYGQYDVRSLGAVADALTYTDGLATSGAANLSSASATFRQNDVGKPFFLNGGGVGGLAGAPWAGTIATVIDANNIVLSGTVDTTTSGVQTLVGAIIGDDGIGGTAGYYLPGVDTISVVGGTSSITAVLNVTATTINPPIGTTPAIAIASAGSGGTPGNYLFETNGGVGTPAVIRVIVDATGVAISVSQTGQTGLFTTNPSTSACPLVDSVSGLTGLTISIATIGVAIVTVNTAGSYTVIPTDPFATGAGSTSGATGCTLDGSWSGSGQFLYGTNARDAIASAINLANTAWLTTRTIVRIPAGNYLLDGAVLPALSTPVLVEGDGVNQTNIILAPTYAGPGVFAPSDLFPNTRVTPAIGSIGAPTQALYGCTIQNLTITGNRSSANRQSGIVTYGRVDGLFVNNVRAEYLNGSAIWTGNFGATLNGFLRETTIQNGYFRNCGASGFPVLNLDSVGTTAGDNFIRLLNINLPFTQGVGLSLTDHTTKRDGVKTIYIDGFRGERRLDTATFPVIQIGSPTDLSACTNVFMNNIHLVATAANTSALVLYGMTEATRPHDISINGLFINGPMLGTGVTIYAGYNIYINAEQVGGRAASIASGNHSDYRATTTAGVGSTSSTVVTAAGPAADNGNAGAAAVMTVPCEFTGVQSGTTTLTVTVVASGRLLPGAVITTLNRGCATVVSQLTGSAGSTGTYQMSFAQTFSSTPLSAVYTESRNVVSYVASTKTSTIGPLQGSAATWTNTPVSGDSISFQSLVDIDIYINGNGQEAFYTYALGSGVAALITSPVIASGIPTGAGTIARDMTFTGDVKFTTGSNITATGTNQAGAYLITKAVTIFDTVAPGAGTVLPPWSENDHRKIINRGANSLLLYPASGAQLEALGANNPGTITSGGAADAYADTTNLWRVT